MPSFRLELAASVLVVLALAGVPLWVAATEARASRVPAEPGARVVTLTAVAAGGIWTEEDVVGHSYWRRSPEPARPVFRAGETVVLRLKSADVSHSFSIPELDVGPVAVEPGHVAVVRFVPAEPGEYLVQCSTRCGPCHEEMLGTILVLGPGERAEDHPDSILPPRTKCPLHGAQNP